MPTNTTPEEQTVFDLVKTSFEGPDAANPKKLSDLQVKILADLQTEFEASPGRTTPEAIHDLIQKDIDAVPVKKKGFFGKMADKAKDAGNQIANSTVHLSTNIAGQTVRQDVNQHTVKSVLPADLQKIDPDDLHTLAGNVKTVAEQVYKAADAHATAKPKTLESMIEDAAGPDKVLKPLQLKALAQNKEFTDLVKAVGGTLEVDVINAPKHDNDEVVIGGSKHINLGQLLGGQGVTINDDTAPNSATGFKPGTNVVQNAKGGR